MGNTVTVFTTPSCTMCRATKHRMDKYDIEYLEADLADFPDVLKAAQNQGITNAPVVVVGDQMWGGFNPERIKELRDAKVAA